MSRLYREGVDYYPPRKINWERVGERMAWAFIVMAAGYFIIRTVLTFA